MPASIPTREPPATPPVDRDHPTPASGGRPLRGRLLSQGKVHRRDVLTGRWVEADEFALPTNVDDLQSKDEVSAVQRDARAQIVKLEADLRRLAPAAMADPKVRQECADIQSRLRAAHDVIELDSLAREETARRDREALSDGRGEAVCGRPGGR